MMRRITFAVSVMALGAFLLAASPASQGDLERLKGQWVMVSLEIDGEPAAEDLIASARLSIDGNRYNAKYSDQQVSETIKLDGDTSPKSIDFLYVDGPRKGEKVKGIYKIEGDRYTLCRPILAEDERPSEFASKADSGLVLAVWTRDNDFERSRRKAIEVDRKALDGTWIGEFNRRDGKDVPADQIKSVRLLITGDRYTMMRGGDKTSRGTNKIDPTKSPKTMDISIIDGIYKGQTWLGIYEVAGDTYRSCFSTDGKTRPTQFSSEPGSGHVLWHFRRESP